MSDLNSFLSSATSLSARSSPPLKTHASAARNLWAARSLLFSSASPRRSEAASARDSEAAARARRNSAASSPPAGAPGSQPVPSPPPACPEPARKPLSRRAPVSSSTIELLNDRSGRPSRGPPYGPTAADLPFLAHQCTPPASPSPCGSPELSSTRPSSSPHGVLTALLAPSSPCHGVLAAVLRLVSATAVRAGEISSVRARE
mmetsp:Transcript_4327/g.13892  ORF Transcript_4327/g.13892 Transcript_4327/m.13892 type:complete len:203 (-) Transcript_4327:145-753(-)